jgi:hypothetical protein
MAELTRNGDKVKPVPSWIINTRTSLNLGTSCVRTYLQLKPGSSMIRLFSFSVIYIEKYKSRDNVLWHLSLFTVKVPIKYYYIVRS